MVMLAPGLSKKPSHTLVTFGAGVAIGVVLSWWCRRARFELATALVARLAVVQRWWPFRRHVRGKEPFKMEDHLSLVARQAACTAAWPHPAQPYRGHGSHVGRHAASVAIPREELHA